MKIRDIIGEARPKGDATTMAPKWFREGSRLSEDDLTRLDAAEFIDGDEFDYEWRLCRVPVSLLPTLTPEQIADFDSKEPGRLDGIRAWLRGHGIDALRDRPIVMVLTSTGIKLLDGWHRSTMAHELRWPMMWAAVGLEG